MSATKETGTATDDEIDRLVIPFALDADGIEDLCNGFRMLEISSSQTTKEIQARVLSAEEEPELSDEDFDWLNCWASMTQSVWLEGNRVVLDQRRGKNWP